MVYKYNVVVLTRDISYRKAPEMKLLSKVRYRAYPEFKNALLNRHIMYNKTVERILELEENDEVFVIRPKNPLEIGRLEKNTDKIQKVYDAGFNDAEDVLYEIKEWMDKIIRSGQNTN